MEEIQLAVDSRVDLVLAARTQIHADDHRNGEPSPEPVVKGKSKGSAPEGARLRRDKMRINRCRTL